MFTLVFAFFICMEVFKFLLSLLPEYVKEIFSVEFFMLSISVDFSIDCLVWAFEPVIEDVNFVILDFLPRLLYSLVSFFLPFLSPYKAVKWYADIFTNTLTWLVILFILFYMACRFIKKSLKHFFLASPINPCKANPTVNEYPLRKICFLLLIRLLKRVRKFFDKIFRNR